MSKCDNEEMFANTKEVIRSRNQETNILTF
jgi:hypothetical protein